MRQPARGAAERSHPPGAVADPLFPVALQGRLVEFAEHEVANFVLQAWLQRTASPAHLKAALEELAPAMAALVRGAFSVSGG